MDFSPEFTNIAKNIKHINIDAEREIADALISVKEPLDNFYNRFLQNCVGKSKMDKL